MMRRSVDEGAGRDYTTPRTPSAQETLCLYTTLSNTENGRASDYLPLSDIARKREVDTGGPLRGGKRRKQPNGRPVMTEEELLSMVDTSIGAVYEEEEEEEEDYEEDGRISWGSPPPPSSYLLSNLYGIVAPEHGTEEEQMRKLIHSHHEITQDITNRLSKSQQRTIADRSDRESRKRMSALHQDIHHSLSGHDIEVFKKALFEFGPDSEEANHPDVVEILHDPAKLDYHSQQILSRLRLEDGDESAWSTNDAYDTIGIRAGEISVIVPKLNSRRMRKRVPRLDGKGGKPDSNRYGIPYQDAVIKRNKVLQQSVTWSFLYMVAGEAQDDVKRFIETKYWDEMKAAKEEEDRTKRTSLVFLEAQLKGLMDKYGDFLAISIESRAAADFYVDLASRSSKALALTQRYRELLPVNNTVMDVILLESVRNAAIALNQFYDSALDKEVQEQFQETRASSRTIKVQNNDVLRRFKTELGSALQTELLHTSTLANKTRLEIVQGTKGRDKRERPGRKKSRRATQRTQSLRRSLGTGRTSETTSVVFSPPKMTTDNDSTDDADGTEEDDDIQEDVSLRDTLNSVNPMLEIIYPSLEYIEKVTGSRNPDVIRTYVSSATEKAIEQYEDMPADSVGESEQFKRYQSVVLFALVYIMTTFLDANIGIISLGLRRTSARRGEEDSRGAPSQVLAHSKKFFEGFGRQTAPGPQMAQENLRVDVDSGLFAMFRDGGKRVRADRENKRKTPLAILVRRTKKTKAMPFLYPSSVVSGPGAEISGGVRGPMGMLFDRNLPDIRIPLDRPFSAKLEDLVFEGIDVLRNVLSEEVTDRLEDDYQKIVNEMDRGNISPKKGLLEQYEFLKERILVSLVNTTKGTLPTEEGLTRISPTTEETLKRLEERIKSLTKDVIRVARPVYSHPPDYVMSEENSGYIQVTPEFYLANDFMWRMVQNLLPGVANGGIEHLQDNQYAPSVFFARMVGNYISMTKKKASRQIKRADLRKESMIDATSAVKQLSHYRWNGSGYTYNRTTPIGFSPSGPGGITLRAMNETMVTALMTGGYGVRS